MEMDQSPHRREDVGMGEGVLSMTRAVSSLGLYSMSTLWLVLLCSCDSDKTFYAQYDDLDYAQCISVEQDGLLYLGCQKETDQEYIYEGELLEVDADGQILSVNKLGTVSSVEALIIESGEILALCDADMNVFESTLSLVKVDSEGTCLWNTECDDIQGSNGHSLIAATDGGYLVSGWAGTFPNQQGLIVKFTRNGAIEWSRLYGGEDIAHFPDIIPIDDGYLAIGHSMSQDHEGDVCFLLMDDEGNELHRTYGGLVYETSGSVLLQTQESIVALCGASARDHIDPILLVLDDSLAVDRVVNLGATSLVEFAIDMKISPNGNLAVLVSRFNSEQNGSGIYLLEVTIQGDVLRQREIMPEEGYLIPSGFAVMEDASLYISGYYAPPGSAGDNNSAFLLRTDAAWNVTLP